ncbi:MAG: V-type ATP synthase subunit I [Halofilum sp. (in: g-proteobacteria)]|nr:V-type ATP synthase subunit I [Halofilum sp. (in: g-proteobacteria)]
MSITAVQKVTCYGPLADKEGFLEAVQALGVMHRIPLRAAPQAAEDEGPSTDTRRAFRFLLAAPRRRRQVHDERRFDAEAVVQRALAIEERLHTLRTEHDNLLQRAEALAPWGDFAFPDPAELGDLYFWFYVVPHYRLSDLRELPHPWCVVRRESRFSYVVVLAPEEPTGMPVARAHTGSQRLADVNTRLEHVDAEIEDLEAERVGLTRWLDLFAASLNRLEDRADRRRAAEETFDDEQLFALRGWVSAAAIDRLREIARQHRFAITVEPPGADETPPTILDNPPITAGGEDLVTFYMTPGYRLWDPSSAVLFSFAAFFALILADAGYALTFGGIIALFWQRMGRSDAGRRLRRVFALLATMALAWGVAAGSYFGVSPPDESLAGALRVVDPTRADVMMRVSVLIGVGHIVLANIAECARRWPDQAALAPAGWVVALFGASALWLGFEAERESVWQTGAAVMAIGLLARPRRAGTWVWRLLARRAGAGEGRRRAFGDVLSYLRLFALGLATASLAATFNELAGGVARASPAFGMLGALLVLAIGHSLNFTLAVVGGFVHGLRLNYIEFFNWGLSGEGLRFRPFAKREKQHWTPSS